jgi:acyl-CoA synthetase (AMP-forming)/AMP-acid ligase II
VIEPHPSDRDLAIHNYHDSSVARALKTQNQNVRDRNPMRPDGYRAEVPELYVVLRRKDPEIIADLEAHIRLKLPGVPGAWPKWIVPLSALPLTAGGAIDHLALRRDAAARAAKEAQLVSQFAAALSCRESAIWCSGSK